MSTAIRALHVLAAITWVGGMLFVALVLVPGVRRLGDEVPRARLMHVVGVRFRTVGWIALGVLIATGLGNLWYRPYLLSVPRFHLKLALVAIALIVAAAHDFVVGPRAGAPGAAPAWRSRASWIARINVLVVVAVVVIGVALRG
jgi:uncharacterized membrane protein